jgi:hypothetical protein
MQYEHFVSGPFNEAFFRTYGFSHHGRGWVLETCDWLGNPCVLYFDSELGWSLNEERFEPQPADVMSLKTAFRRQSGTAIRPASPSAA